jgi:hypothetical protein
MLRMANQAKLKAFRRGPIYKFGYEVPQNHDDVLHIDAKCKNTCWQDSERLELAQLDEYDTFHDLGKARFDAKGRLTNAPEGYKKIRVRIVYDVKGDGRHKSRCVAGGHLTEVPVDSVYSGVVSLRSLRLCVFLSELNDLELWGADIGNAYLEAETKEKVFIVAGKEFGDREGHILVIHKALYGLCSSGLRWGEKFSDTLRDMGFEPSKADPMLWLRANEEADVYEYIAVYVDDLAIAAKNPQEIIDWLTDPKKGNFKLKGIGPLTYHLGCDFQRDPDGTLHFGPFKYIG